MTAASPGIIATTLLNAYYDTYERYVMALAREMHKEYDLLHARGFVLQLDCPDLAMERPGSSRTKSVAEFVKIVELHIEAHQPGHRQHPAPTASACTCAGATTTARTCTTCRSRPSCPRSTRPAWARSPWLGNPRHQHEYKVIKRMRLPDGMLFVPGVIDTTTNYVEHPEVVADRIARPSTPSATAPAWLPPSIAASARSRARRWCAESVVWAKLRALARAPAMASRRLG